MSAHTKGPWSVYPETDGTEICAVDMAPGLPIRQIIARPVIGNNWIANARLIAASPDLLEAVIQLLRNFPTDSDLIEAGWEQLEIEHAMKAHDVARAVVARAAGEQP